MIKGSNTKIKVSQATIDKIKKMGMTAALKGAPKASAEMQEGLRRMYGQRRLDAASKTTTVSKPSRAVMARPGSTPRSTAPGAISGRTPVKSAQPKKPTPTARPNAAQIKAGESRAGGSYKYNPSQKVGTKPAKSAAEKAKEAADRTARRKAAAAAVKRAGGRTA